MLAHYHGQVLNVPELATALEVAQATVRRYVDLFLIRQLRPWRENLRKRQVKRPKVYVRDSGLYHQLIGVATMDALQMHPRIGPSWEGFILEKVVAESAPEEVYFWATHIGAELDLLLLMEASLGNGANRRPGSEPLRPCSCVRELFLLCLLQWSVSRSACGSCGRPACRSFRHECAVLGCQKWDIFGRH